VPGAISSWTRSYTVTSGSILFTRYCSFINYSAQIMTNNHSIYPILSSNYVYQSTTEEKSLTWFGTGALGVLPPLWPFDTLPPAAARGRFGLGCYPPAVCYLRWSGLRPAVCYRRWFSGPLYSSVVLLLVLLSHIFCSIVVYLGSDPSFIISCRSESSNISLVVIGQNRTNPD
jgi:hypothetical protein